MQQEYRAALAHLQSTGQRGQLASRGAVAHALDWPEKHADPRIGWNTHSQHSCCAYAHTYLIEGLTHSAICHHASYYDCKNKMRFTSEAVKFPYSTSSAYFPSLLLQRGKFERHAPPGGGRMRCCAPYLLWDAGAAAGLAACGVALAGGEQRAGQDGAEVVEGAPAYHLCLLAQVGLRAPPREQLGQQRLLRVAVATECPHHTQQGWHCVPAEVFWKREEVCFFIIVSYDQIPNCTLNVHSLMDCVFAKKKSPSDKMNQ